jgi:hypothetical protein
MEFVLEIFKVSYVKKKFDGPCVTLARRPCVDAARDCMRLHATACCSEAVALIASFSFVIRPSFLPFHSHPACSYTLAQRALDNFIESPRLTDESKLAALSTITLPFVHATFNRFIADAFVTAFTCGSASQDMSAAVCRCTPGQSLECSHALQQLQQLRLPASFPTPPPPLHHRIFIDQLHGAAHAPSSPPPTSLPPSPPSPAHAFVPEDSRTIRSASHVSRDLCVT